MGTMCIGQTKGDTYVEEQTRGGTPSEEPTRREDTKGCGCSKLKLRGKFNGVIPSNETNKVGDGIENSGETAVAGTYESENSEKPGWTVLTG